MQVDQVAVILVEPTHPGNIGAAARAMKNMGLSDLRLVRPARFPDAEATARASGADDLLAAATVHEGLGEALAGVQWVVGTTARKREMSNPVQTPDEAAATAVGQANAGRPAALVFGRERSGLTNEELDRCDRLVHIPTAEAYSSLNLAQAVQILVYEVQVAATRGAPSGTRADTPAVAGGEVMEGLFQHFERLIRDVAFLDPQNPQRTYRRLRRILRRAGLAEGEVFFLRGFLAACEKRIHGWTPRKKKGETDDEGRES